MSIDDSIISSKHSGSTIRSAWANAMQAALGGGTPAQPAKYIIFYDTISGTFKARSGATGAITYEDADFLDVTNPALLGCTTGGRVHISQSCTAATFADPIQILQDATWLTIEPGVSLVHTGTDDAVQIGDSTHPVYYCGIEGARGAWINRAVPGGVNGIHVYDGHVCEIRDLNVDNFSNAAVKLERAWETHVQNCRLIGRGPYALSIAGIGGNQTNNSYINNNFIAGGTTSVIDVTGAAPENIIIYHNGISDGVNGVTVHDAANILIQHNYFEANTDKNIYLQGDTTELKAPRVRDNWINILAAADYGIYVADADNAIIQGNSITQSGGACTGIYLAAAATNATVWPNFLDAGVTNTYVDTASLKVNRELQFEIHDHGADGFYIDETGWQTSGANVFTFNPDNYPPIISIKMRGMLWAAAHPGEIYTKLYNATHAADVTGGGINTTGHSSWENKTTSDFKAEIPSGEHDYTLMYLCVAAPGYMGNVKLIVQTN